MNDPHESITTIGIGEFSITIPTVTRRPTITIISIFKNKRALLEFISRLTDDILASVDEYTNYIKRLKSDLWGSLLIIALKSETDQKDLIEKLNVQLKSIEGVSYKITPYVRVFKSLYIIKGKPVMRLLNEQVYILPDSYISANLRTLIESLGKGSSPIIRNFGQKIGEGIAHSLKKILTDEDLSVDRKELLESLVLYASYTDQLPYCLGPEIVDQGIRIKIREDITNEEFKNGVRYLNYGIIEKLVEEFGFKTKIRRLEILELVVDLDGIDYVIRVE
ncbi:MAG: hypothetical protein J7K58_03525 [Euryarchaeota archaeon]|nr:hypothetical protein [Euryarchaeota archaeon]